LEVHGGAWTSGDRLNNSAIGEYLAAHGIVMPAECAAPRVKPAG
jgi:hypothetical protein